MPTIINELNNPSFVFFPMNNDRTAWRPYGAPAILVVPHRRNVIRQNIPNSQIFNVRVAVEGVPQYALVAGHDHIGLRFPDKELYGLNLTSLILGEKYINVPNAIFYRNNAQITYGEAVTGDFMAYTTASGVYDLITYIEGADYYDLSDVLIEVETLPSSTYNLSYTAYYYSRVINENGSFICIDVDSIALALSRSRFQHPGKVMDEFYRHTPVPYLTSSTKALDTTIGLYRPFTDIMQDVMDEQDILERVNWVYECPAETIPYLSALLGWDIPFFPRSLDSLRRAVLRRTVELQRFKGSRRAILNIFKIFGYNILITNLWYSSDGKRFIRPDESLPNGYKDEEISSSISYTFNPLLGGYAFDKFSTIEVPLVFRPQVKVKIDDFDMFNDDGPVTIDAYAVASGSDADFELKSILAEATESVETYGTTIDVIVDPEGFLNATSIHLRLNGLPIKGYSQILLSGRLGLASDEVLVGSHPPLRKHGVTLDRDLNIIRLVPNGLYDKNDKIIVYAFATFNRATFTIPDKLANLRSNRFAIQVLTPDLTEYADQVTLDFALEFVYKIKAFHSLLYLVRTRLEANENYEVTDLTIGGDYDQRYDTDFGRLQVPPAIIPNVPATVLDCAISSTQGLGYKDADIRLRNLKLRLLIEDYDAWRSLDDRTATESDLLRLLTPKRNTSTTEAVYNYLGQDRITTDDRIEGLGTDYAPSPNSGQHSDLPLKYAVNNIVPTNGKFDEISGDTSANLNASGYGSFNREYTLSRKSFTQLDKVTDYKYKGRLDDEILHRTLVDGSEILRPKGCGFNLGSGVFYAFPSHSTINQTGVAKPVRGSNTPKMTFSGGSPKFNIAYYKEGAQSGYLSIDPNEPSHPKYRSLLGSLYRSYNSPSGETIHYTNRINSLAVDQTYQLALIRPSLDIAKTDLNLPGCRFIVLHALESDYVSDIYTARPWDDEYASPCGLPGSCGYTAPTYLNYKLDSIDGGDQRLFFDSTPYKVTGNNLKPDIYLLGDHGLSTDAAFNEADVIHKVYMKDANSNPAITFEQVCEYDTSTPDGSISTDQPFFDSYNPNRGSNGLYEDYADGYPCLRGMLPYVGLQIGTFAEVLEELGLPVSGTLSPTTYLFTLGSGIKIGKGYRLDCGCNVFGMTDDTTVGDIEDTLCATSVYKDDAGEYDYNNDQLRINSFLNPSVPYGVANVRLDGTIGSLLETI